MTDSLNVYDSNTVNSQNPLARFAHRSRMQRYLKYLVPRLENREGKMLDYGCGSGFLISQLLAVKPYSVFGYEPVLTDRTTENLPISPDLETIRKNAPYHTITCFEVMEHLQWKENAKILSICRELLTEHGELIVSVPIEIGPAVLFKEMNRFRIYRKWRYRFVEFIATTLFGVPGTRPTPDLDYQPHKGFDFRDLIKFFKSKSWKVSVLCYSPLPTGVWYGNSQVFLRAKPL